MYYEYGPTGNMDLVLDGKTGLRTYYEYDPAARARYQHHPNATATYFVHDAAGRLTEKVTKKDADGSVLVRFAYTRDAAGNPIAIERESGLGAFYYAYDALQRLAYEGQFVSAARQYENYYEYDPAGNRTLLRHGETDAENLTYYEYDEANELTGLHDVDGWTYFAYDGNGNTVTEQTPDYTRYYDWDGRDMMVGVRSTEANWTDNQLAYDGVAALTRLGDSTGASYFVWDDPESSLKLTQHPVFGADMPLDLLLVADGSMTPGRRHVLGRNRALVDDDVALVEAISGGVVPVHDDMGTVWKTVSTGAQVADEAEYDSFGVIRYAAGVLGQWGFASKQRLADLGLLSFPGRAYQPLLGGFASRDPLGALVPRVYTYAGSQPTSRRDPYGLDAFDECYEEMRWLREQCLRYLRGEDRKRCIRNYARHMRQCVYEHLSDLQKTALAWCAEWEAGDRRGWDCVCTIAGLMDMMPLGPWQVPFDIVDCICQYRQFYYDSCKGPYGRGVVQGILAFFDCASVFYNLAPGLSLIEALHDIYTAAVIEAIHLEEGGTIWPGLQDCVCWLKGGGAPGRLRGAAPS